MIGFHDHGNVASMADPLDIDALLAASQRGPDECWPWAGSVHPTLGYGTAGSKYAHRIAWERANGPIPEGLTIDHVGHEFAGRCCVNPAHMECVTRAENAMRGSSPIALNARKDECINGHPLTGANLIIRHHPGRADSRACRTCKRERERARYHAQRA